MSFVSCIAVSQSVNTKLELKAQLTDKGICLATSAYPDGDSPSAAPLPLSSPHSACEDLNLKAHGARSVVALSPKGAGGAEEVLL